MSKKIIDTQALSRFAEKMKAWVSAQGYTKNDGTITGISMNGESVGTVGVVNLSNVVTGTNPYYLQTSSTAPDTNTASNIITFVIN